MSERPEPPEPHDTDSTWATPNGWGVPAGDRPAGPTSDGPATGGSTGSAHPPASSAAVPAESAPHSAAGYGGSAALPDQPAQPYQPHQPYSQAHPYETPRPFGSQGYGDQQTRPTEQAQQAQQAQPAQPTHANPYATFGPAQDPRVTQAAQHSTRSTAPGGPHHPTAAYGGYGGYQGFPPPPPTRSTREPKRPRVWLAVSTAAVLAAALAAGGTAALISPDDASGGGLTQTTQTSQPVTGTPDWSEVAANVRPAVVAIDVARSDGEALGSGVVIDGSGHVVTNNHVVAGAREVRVTTADGQIIGATVVGTDPTTDLAVIKLDSVPDGLEPATLGTSDSLQVGEPVMAVGNPLGLDSTVTTGIVSALDRPVSASDGSGGQPTITNAIQVDAAINPGNSGGPLFDSAGTVVGITSSIATTSKSSGSIGLGFAIPVDLVKNIAEQLIANGVAEHAFLGVSMKDAAATAGGVTRTGAEVIQVQPGTPAEAAGVKQGDVIVAIDGADVASAESLTGYVRQYSAGDKVKLTVIRSGKELTLTATLTTRVESN